LARFFPVLARFFSVWLGFSGLARFFSGFLSVLVRFGFFGFLLIKPKPNRTSRVFQKFNWFNWFFFSVRFFQLFFSGFLGLIGFLVFLLTPTCVYCVQRFFPSEFTMDVDHVNAVEPAKTAFAMKAQIRRAIEAAGIPYTYVSSNGFAAYHLATMAQLGLTAPPRDKITILGDGNAKGNKQYAVVNSLCEI
jgi:hypothetical protein